MSNKYPNLIRWADWLDNIYPGQEGNNDESESVQFLLHFCSDEDAHIAMMCEPFFKSLDEIAEANNVTVEEIASTLEEMSMKGLIMCSSLSGVLKYRRWPWLPGILEFVVLDKEIDPELLKYASDFYEERIRLTDMTAMPFEKRAHGGLRTIPIMESVAAKSTIMPFEELKPFIDKATKFSVANCACRTATRALGMGCEHTHIDTCIQLDDYADYGIRTQRAREISKEEVYEILRKMEKAGHVHQVFNTQGHDTTCFICNCCGCGCASLRTANMLNLQMNMASNFVAKVDPEKCVACGACVESCNANALTLGTNFCEAECETKNLPDYMDTNWTEEFWDMDYLKRKMVNKSGSAPCKAACPAHISIQGYIRKAAEGKYDEALKVIKRDNPFPAVCGRICPHDCENECTRARVDEAMAIDDIKKFIADKELEEGNLYVPEKKDSYEEKVAVIGAGPAGMTAAYYLAVEGYPVTVFEKNAAPGGMLKFGIPSFRLKKDVIDAEIEVLRRLGVEFKCGVDVGRDVTIEQLREQGYKAFYVAIGAQASRKLGIEGEELIGVQGGINFLRGVNEGVISSVEGDTVVIGGGNVAVDVARAVMRLGNRNVKMVCLEKDEEMPTVPDEKDEALAEGVEICNSWGPKRIIGENGRVTGVEFMRCVSVFDETGRFSPVYDENDTVIMPCSNVFTAIGQSIVWGDLLSGTKAKVEDFRVVNVAEISYQTAEEDIFAGGDCAMGPGFTIDAIATGRSGAISVHRYVQGKNLLIRREREYKPFDKELGDYSGFDKQPRQRPHHAAASKALETMDDTRATFTEEQLKKEAARCMGCGVTVVDERKCLGCGVCTTKCEFDAVKLYKVHDAVPPTSPDAWAAALGANIAERTKRIAANSPKTDEQDCSDSGTASMMFKKHESEKQDNANA